MVGISVVVVSYNSEKLIEPTLKCLFSQKNTENFAWEIILVNNNSTDNTVSIANKMAKDCNFSNFKIVDESKAGTAFARFKGVNTAQYNVVCFVDDDNRIAENFIEKAFEIMQNDEIGILGCGGVAEFEKKPPHWFENEKEAYAIGSLYPNNKLENVTFDANMPTACMCIRKEIFDNLYLQKWQPQLTGRNAKSQAPGEDTELCQAARLLGYKCFYTNELTFVHYMPSARISWERFLQMTYGFGVTDVFLLAYKLEYEKREFDSNVKYIVRKSWLFNYLGKKANLLQKYFKFKIGKIDSAQFEKIQARNNGFCETIIKEKTKFSGTFYAVSRLLSVK